MIPPSLLLQAAAAPQTIIPQDQYNWVFWIVRNIMPLAAFSAIIWRAAVRPINDRIDDIDDPKTGTLVTGLNGMGLRVEALEKHATECGTRTTDMQRILDTATADITRSREEYSATAQAIKELTQLTRDNAQQTHTMLANVRVDLGRAEERLKMMGEFKDVLREVLLQVRKDI